MVEEADCPKSKTPKFATKTQNRIALEVIEGAEYQKDKGIWQTSPEFTELISDTIYSFIARIKGTSTHVETSESMSSRITTASKELTSTVEGINFKTIYVPPGTYPRGIFDN